MIIKITHNSIKLFNKEIPFYGIAFVLGFVVAVLTALFRTKKYQIKKSEIAYSGVFAGVGGLLGAKVLSVITSIKYIIKYKPSILEIVQNGFVFYGGLIGGFIGLFIYVKAYKLSFKQYCDIFAPSVAIGHAIGRIGCLFSGCCYGKISNTGIRVCYLSSVNPNTPLNVPILALPLIESIFLVIIYLLCEVLFYKTKTKGIVAIVYSFSYAIIRFVLEFFRGDAERGVYLGLSTSQYVSLGIMLVIFIIIGKYLYKKIKTHYK